MAVARVFNQRYGIDYGETYSPTVNHDTVRMLFALAAKHNWSVHHIDVATAFLQGELEERLFIEQPEGFRSGPEVCRLKKAIYGLKQASRAWNETLRKFVLDSGFSESSWDSCVFFKGTGENFIIPAIYVDDILIFSARLRAIEDAKALMSGRFQIWDLGEVSSYLGVRVTRDAEG